MKHPTYTQRYFYLLSLRKALPNNTPFFDLATHRRTPHGETIPHLVVKCGENHITGLSEILSSYLDGQVNNTALFVASQAVKSMTQEEIAHMFNTHTKFIESIQRLSLYPRVINIDRERNEKYGSTEITRSTREWARSLKTAEGKPLRCDAENGGQDRRAYLLVSTPYLERAKTELQHYLQAIRNPSQYHNDSPSEGQNTNSAHTRPTEIYIPTPAVLHNLQFLNSLSSAEVWKAAPQAIRKPPNAKQTPPTGKLSQDKPTIHHHTAQAPVTQATTIPASTQNTTSNATFRGTADANEFPYPTATANLDNRQDDTTVGTTTSNFTRTTHNQNQSIHNARFQELEAQIKQHQTEFKDIHARFDHLNEQLLRSMHIASTHSAQFSQLEKQFSEMNAAIQTLILRTTDNQHHNQAPIISQLQTSPTTNNVSTHHSENSFQHRLSITTAASTPISSPEKKRIRPTNEELDSPSNVQEQSAQYEESTPVDSDT